MVCWWDPSQSNSAAPHQQQGSKQGFEQRSNFPAGGIGNKLYKAPFDYEGAISTDTTATSGTMVPFGHLAAMQWPDDPRAARWGDA